MCQQWIGRLLKWSWQNQPVRIIKTIVSFPIITNTYTRVKSLSQSCKHKYEDWLGTRGVSHLKVEELAKKDDITKPINKEEAIKFLRLMKHGEYNTVD